MPTLRKQDMYDKEGNCTLPKFSSGKNLGRNKYIPKDEDEKRAKWNEEHIAMSSFRINA